MNITPKAMPNPRPKTTATATRAPAPPQPLYQTPFKGLKDQLKKKGK